MTTAKLLGAALLGSASLVTAAAAEPVAEGGRKFTTPMSGAEECNATGCGVGDPDGTARGSITVNVGQQRVCWEFTNVTNLTPQHRAHIHKARAGTNGDIVVNFFNLAVGQQGPLTGCTTAVLTRALLKDIIQHPSEYYLNLHNEPFPAGAVRGQLEKK
jgi:hypothetical protein